MLVRFVNLIYRRCMPKPYIFSLDESLHQALKVAAASRREPMSALVEQGIRHVLALPEPEKSDGGSAFEMTRTEDAMLYELGKAGPGWHKGYELARKVGCSFRVGEKALLGLARRGKVHRWGDAGEFSDGSQAGGTWGLEEPRTVIRRLVGKLGSAWHPRWPHIMELIDKLAKGISTEALQELRPEIWKATRNTVESWPMLNITEELALAYARERERAAVTGV